MSLYFQNKVIQLASNYIPQFDYTILKTNEQDVNIFPSRNGTFVHQFHFKNYWVILPSTTLACGKEYGDGCSKEQN